ncbi:MAG: hypothetical protein ACNS64_11605 [Candidatus Halalkalibacterium sp. M3_1C_030]
MWPWLANARNWMTIFAHLVFGLVAAWAYFKLRERNTATEETATA